MGSATMHSLGVQQSSKPLIPQDGNRFTSRGESGGGGILQPLFPIVRPPECSQTKDMELGLHAEGPSRYTCRIEPSRNRKLNAPDFKWTEGWFAPGLLTDRVAIREENGGINFIHMGRSFGGQAPTCTHHEDFVSRVEKAEFGHRFEVQFDASRGICDEMLMVDKPLYSIDLAVDELLRSFDLASDEPLLIDDFIWKLQKCRKRKDIQHARLIHAYACSHGLENHVAVGNHIVPMFVECGSMYDAQQVFYRLVYQNEHAWTSLISGFSECGQWHHSLNLHQRMQELCVHPTSYTYVALLKACARHKDMRKGQEIHVEIARMGCENDLPVGNTLVSMYAKCGLLSEAREVFDQLPDQDFVSWNALIAGYAEHGPDHEALKVFEQMQLEGVSATDGTFACVLKACGSLRAIEMGQTIHMETIEKGLEKELSVGNSLVGMYAKFRSMPEAHAVFEMLPVKDVVSWTALVAGYVEHGPAQEALKVFEQMQVEGITPNDVTYSCVLKACGSLGALCKGREIHMQISEKGFGRYPSVCNSLISMYASCGSISEAQEFFHSLPTHNAITWSSMIKGLGMNHEGNMAVQCFEDMMEQGAQPNNITFSCLFKACSHSSLVCKGTEYFKMMTEGYDIAPTIEHYTCMVDMLARSGHLYEAEKFLETLGPLSEGAWTALLSACRTYGEAELGWRCFQQLVLLNPEDSTWYLLMTDIYASTGWHPDDACRIEHLRKHLGAINRPGIATIEVNKEVHEFVGGNNQSKDVSKMLEVMSLRMKEGGHVPNLDLVLGPISEEKKEATLCEHAERFAIAFGLLNAPQGETLRVTKNLRMCNDCHNVSKLISKTERREIVLRDDCCIHHFKDGSCDCGDMF